MKVDRTAIDILKKVKVAAAVSKFLCKHCIKTLVKNRLDISE